MSHSCPVAVAPCRAVSVVDRTPTAPKPGQVFRAPNGAPMLYVRTEKRPGAKEPERLFVQVDPELRIVLERWTPESAPLPEGMELVLDPLATRRADEAERELAELSRRWDALVAAMKSAVAVLPVASANELRRVYREAVAR